LGVSAAPDFLRESSQPLQALAKCAALVGFYCLAADPVPVLIAMHCFIEIPQAFIGFAISNWIGLDLWWILFGPPPPFTCKFWRTKVEMLCASKW